MRFENNREFRPPRPFRFQPMWLSHPLFSNVVKEAWHNPSSLQQALAIFTCLSISPNFFLVELEKKLRLEYKEVAKLEEESWAMKARILWLVEGDRNTSFYHTSTLVRRRRNHILCMKDRMGNWLNGEREIADFIRKWFLELFTSDHFSFALVDWDPPSWKTYLQEDALTALSCLVSDREISMGLWAFKPFKAPGSDGFHAGFFQRFWLLVGDSVKSEVKSIFTLGVISEYLNQTLITLIPKCKNLESLYNYRLISLCNTIYKVVTKIIVNWIRPFLADIVSPL